jgi:hypothetical protein
MNVTIGLSDQNAAELEAQARAARMPADRYLEEVVAHVLENRHKSKVHNLEEHMDTMASHVAPGTTADEMEAALQEALDHVRQAGSVGAAPRLPRLHLGVKGALHRRDIYDDAR